MMFYFLKEPNLTLKILMADPRKKNSVIDNDRFFLGGGGIRVAPYIIHKVVSSIYTLHEVDHTGIHSDVQY